MADPGTGQDYIPVTKRSLPLTTVATVVCLPATQWRHLTTQWGTRTRCEWIHGRPQGADGTGAVPLVAFVPGSMGDLVEKDGE